jgi:hypothetical protein
MFQLKNLSSRWLLAPLALVPLAVSCDNSDDDSSDGLKDSAAASTFDGEIARAWMNQMYALVKSNGTAPPQASRIYGYCGVTIYEASVRGMKDHNSLEGQLNGLVDLSEPTNKKHHWPSVVNRAMAVVATSFYAGNAAAIDALEDGFDATYDGTVAADIRARSIQYGEDLGGRSS